MPITSMLPNKLKRSRFGTPLTDKFTVVLLAACAFALIISPLLIFSSSADFQPLEGRPENRIFWPAITAIAVLLAAQDRARFSKLTWPPHIICLFAYLAFAGASVLWAFSPERSFIRFEQQFMIVTSIVLSSMLASRSADIMRWVFLCFSLSLTLNIFFVLGGYVTIATYSTMHGVMLIDLGYRGYFSGKSYLGECASVSLLLSFHELICHRGWRRTLGFIFVVVATVLIFVSGSKTALGLAVVSPLLARFTLFTRNITRISPAVILLSLPLCYAATSSVLNISIMDRAAYILYHDSSLTGRTIIWDFARYEIGQRPLLGWGYQSFWLVPGSPSLNAPGWVKTMPEGHNGYYDTMLELGYVGLAFLVVFLVATLHAIGRVADRDPARARLLLSLALFLMLYNYFESLWMRGFEFLWVVFVIVVAEIGRYWQPLPLRSAARKSRSLAPGSRGALLGARTPGPGTRLS